MITQLDAIVATAIRLSIEDMRKSQYLIEDVLSDFNTNIYLKDKYQGQVQSCVEWFNSNEIKVNQRPRMDRDEFPCICVIPGTSVERPEMKHMGDASTESVILLPSQINKPIPFILKPFTPLGYFEGTVSVDPNLKGLESVVAGQILVDPSNGQGFVIQGVGADYIDIDPSVNLDASQLAVVPQFAYYKARVEHTFFTEGVEVVCYGLHDPQTTIWLWSIVLYSILRYRESLLEANGFSESSVNSSALIQDPYTTGPEGDSAFVRSIQITGLVENTWIKSPRRILENVALRTPITNGFIGGIRILGNMDPPANMDLTQESWFTDKDEGSLPDDE